MRALLALLIALACAGSAFAIDTFEFKDRAEELRFQALTKQLRCLVCQNESLADSGAELAADLRREVFGLMRQGKSDAEIKTFLTERYSDFVLYDPPLRGGTWLLWFGPAVLVVVGAGFVIAIVRRRARAAAKRDGALSDAKADAAVVEDDW
jgi:cytochrome c-type biogenesis protein CcmH